MACMEPHLQPSVLLLGGQLPRCAVGIPTADGDLSIGGHLRLKERSAAIFDPDAWVAPSGDLLSRHLSVEQPLSVFLIC